MISMAEQENSLAYIQKVKTELQATHNLMLMTRDLLSVSAQEGWLAVRNVRFVAFYSIVI
jgi:hypothetical protein